MSNVDIQAIVAIIMKSANTVDTSDDLTSVINQIKTGQRLSLVLKQFEENNLYNSNPKSSECISVFFELKDVLIYKALKRSMNKILMQIESVQSKQSKNKYLNSFIVELNNHIDDFSQDNATYATHLQKLLHEKIIEIGPINDYEISTLGDSLYINIPLHNFQGKAVHSPNGQYLLAGNNHMIALLDTDCDHLMYVYDIFNRVDDSTLVVTDHPFILVRDIVSLGSNRQNDIYLLNHRSDILFKTSVDANVYKLAVSENGKFIAAQTLDDKIRLFSVEDKHEIAVWKTPKKVAIDLSIDLATKEVRMLDSQNHVCSYSF